MANADSETLLFGRNKATRSFIWMRIILLCSWCAWMTWLFIWSIFPPAYLDWQRDSIIRNSIWFSGAAIAFAFSAALLIFQRPASHWLKQVVALHFLLAIFSGIAGFFFLRSITGLFLILAALVDVPILLLAPGRKAEPGSRRLFTKSVLVSIPAAAVGLFAWSALNVNLVEWRAKAIAGPYPYCLQIPADSHHYKAVTRTAELVGLRMQVPFSPGGASGEYRYSFHAVLVVRKNETNEFYNWSYYAQNFVHEPGKAVSVLYLPVSCRPIPAFVDTLK